MLWAVHVVHMSSIVCTATPRRIQLFHPAPMFRGSGEKNPGKILVVRGDLFSKPGRWNPRPNHYTVLILYTHVQICFVYISVYIFGQKKLQHPQRSETTKLNASNSRRSEVSTASGPAFTTACPHAPWINFLERYLSYTSLRETVNNPQIEPYQ